MYQVASTIITVVIFLVVIELLALPDWVARKLRGGLSAREIEERLRSLETRVAEMEKSLSSKN